jgi:hypothetical protein
MKGQAYNTGGKNRQAGFSLFSAKPLRATEGIRYDAGLFGRDDKRRRASKKRYAGA